MKLRSEEEEAYYHCMSRIAGGERLLGVDEKEVLRKQLWKLAEYCGLEVVTYTIMSNHYHVLVRVPQRREQSDEELLRRYRKLYTEMTAVQSNALKVVEADMKKGGELAKSWRARQQRQMYDVSQFNKLLKMRFSIWYNKTHKRQGTLWSERFKSVLVQEGGALFKMAAYIDGNAPRAGLVEDPKDYRYCGYAEALAGNEKARRGLEYVVGQVDGEGMARYRCLIVALLSEARKGKAQASAEFFEQVRKSGGKLPLAVVLGCRIRYFTDGVILGSKEYVERVAPRKEGAERAQAQPLAAITDWGGLHVFARMRSNLWGQC